MDDILDVDGDNIFGFTKQIILPYHLLPNSYSQICSEKWSAFVYFILIWIQHIEITKKILLLWKNKIDLMNNWFSISEPIRCLSVLCSVPQLMIDRGSVIWDTCYRVRDWVLEFQVVSMNWLGSEWFWLGKLIPEAQEDRIPL